MLIIPSIIADTLDELRGKLSRAAGFTDQCQVDFFDGRFVPGYRSVDPGCFPSGTVDITLIAHVLAYDPEAYPQALAQAGFRRMIFHLETADNPRAVIAAASRVGLAVGLGCAPKTSLEDVLEFADLVDELVFLAVNPELPGLLVPDVLAKVSICRGRRPQQTLAVDGGIDFDNIGDVALAGADIAYVGQTIFGAGEPAANFQKLASRAGR